MKKNKYSIYSVEPCGVCEAEIHSKLSARFADQNFGNDVLDFDDLRTKDEQLVIDDRDLPRGMKE